MDLSRRALLRASAAVALTAACAPGGSDHASAPAASTAGSATPTSPSSSPPASSSTSASASRAVSGPASEVRHGPRTSTAVALTFHGNGDVALAERLLRLLESHHVHGTVMAVGTWLKAQPQMAHRITGAGHDLGNHTLHHYPMRSLGASTVSAEIVGCAKVLHHLTGSEGRWFRASGTQGTTSTIRAAAGRAGYAHCISYDVDGLDWQDPSTSTVTRAVLAGARGGSIVSLHLGHPVTVRALPAILDGLHTRGLRPVTLSELLA